MPGYGYRRMRMELWRRGVVVNHKRVLRLLREDNLLCLRRKSFFSTTQSRHGYAIYPNLVPQLTINGVNQLWVADITYVRLEEEFVFLAVLLDAYSRRCVGWELGRSLHAELTLAALRMALGQRSIQPGIVHHSDRGVQYACGEYVALLGQHSFRISMSRAGNPYDNAKAESFIKTLKYEEVYRFEYRNFHEAKARIGEFIEAVYNSKRLHSALGYRSPVEFEQSAR
jgi:putative transposase